LNLSQSAAVCTVIGRSRIFLFTWTENIAIVRVRFKRPGLYSAQRFV